jgi:putative DNA primase/helicase
LLLTGDTDCGKSTIPMAIGWMVGGGNCCSISIEDMDDQRRLAPILGKLVNRMGELKSNAAVADGGFKKLVSTGDSISVEKKFKDIIEYTPVAKHVIATNNLPTVNDRSRATFNRMLLIKFNHSIPKHLQTTDVYDDIKAQLPGLVAWALEGAKRLYAAQGKFTRIQSSEEEINEYKRRENPLLEFIEDYCVPDPKCSIPRDHFQAQLKARGLDKYKTPTSLTRDLKSLGILVEKARCPGYLDAGSVRSVIGYRMRDQNEASQQFTVGEDGMVLVNHENTIN